MATLSITLSAQGLPPGPYRGITVSPRFPLQQTRLGDTVMTVQLTLSQE
jgi:hypothetical protein